MKRVTNLGAHLRVIAPAGNTAPFKKMLQRWQAVGSTVSDLTDPELEPQASDPEMKALLLNQL